MFFDKATAQAVKVALQAMGFTAVVHKYTAAAYAVYVSATNSIMDTQTLHTGAEVRAYILAQH